MKPKNPCTRDCKYDDNNICIVCLRTKKEIFEWGDYTDEQKIEILKRIEKEKSKIWYSKTFLLLPTI